MRLHRCTVLEMALVAMLLAGAPRALAGGFSYQGLLKSDGAPVTGTYELEFTLYDDDTAGEQIGDPAEVSATVTGGLFTVFLNESSEFGSLAFALSGAEYWLRIGIRLPGESEYEYLGQRQRVSPAPYALVSGTLTYITSQDEPSDREAVICVELGGIGRAAKLISSSALNTFDVFRLESAGSGDALKITTTGVGAPLHARATGSGVAGLFEISNGASASDALQVLTSGTGRALRATAASGVGLLAESGSGVGLRATSVGGTALDVVGGSAFSGLAAFNATVPFSVASTARVDNLNVEFFDSHNQAFYRNATNLNAGTLSDGRLSPNVTLLDLAQTFSASKTFAAQSFFNDCVTISSVGCTAALMVSNIGGGAARFDGGVHVTGGLTRAYTVGTFNSAAPLAYASIDGVTGNVVSGTPNLSSTWDGGASRYLISIAGENYTVGQYVSIVTPVITGPAPPVRIATTSANPPQLVVRILDDNGTLVQQGFHVLIYKP